MFLFFTILLSLVESIEFCLNKLNRLINGLNACMVIDGLQ